MNILKNLQTGWVISNRKNMVEMEIGQKIPPKHKKTQTIFSAKENLDYARPPSPFWKIFRPGFPLLGGKSMMQILGPKYFFKA